MAIEINDVVFTTREAADYLGLAEDTVRQYIHRGLIFAKKIGSINVVTRSECERYKRDRRPPGNPLLSRDN